MEKIDDKSKRLSSVSTKKSIKRAVKCLKAGQFGLSCGHFCIAFKSSTDSEATKQLINEWKSTFLYAFDRHIHHLQTISDSKTVITAYDTAIDALPDSEDIYYNKGLYFYKKGCLSEAVECFRSSLSLNPDYNLSHLCLENIKSSSIARWHYIMINDIQRNTAFKTAISIAISNGFNTVLDIGSGSGLLSLYCIQSGAHKVYACEVSQMLYHLCRDVFQVNGVSDKVILFNQMSTNLSIPQMIKKPVNLVVTEIFDAALFGEHVLTTLHSALKTLLDPIHGIVVPNRAVVYGVLIESQELRNSFILKQKHFGNTVISEDVSICADFNDIQYTTINLSKVNKKYLSEKFKIIDINFNDISQIERVLETDFVLNIDVNCLTEGKLDAIGIWFDLNLIQDIYISTEPPTQLIGWEQAVYPTTVRTISVCDQTKVNLSFTLSEDYLRLIDIKIDCLSTDCLSNRKVIKLNSELIKYMNANDLHEKYIKAIEEVIKKENIENLIDINYFPVSSLHFVDCQTLKQIIVVSEDQEIKDNIQKFIEVSNLKITDKINFKSFDELVANNITNGKTLLITDFIETSGLIRTNTLEKMAYLNIYSGIPPIFMPFKVVFKGLIIQSNDLLIRSRLVTDDNVHGFQIKNLLNVFETEILQNIDTQKMDFKELSNSFDLLEIDLKQILKSNENMNFEPQNQCSVNISKCGQMDAILYWYDLYLTQQIVMTSLHLGTDWHSTAFIVKKPISVDPKDIIHINCLFTNGFLRFKDVVSQQNSSLISKTIDFK